MIGEISQITINPVSSIENNTALFEITSDSDELFLPILASSNIVVTKTLAGNSTTISQNTGTNVSVSGGTGGGGSGGSGGGY
jgi:hypothetical protein